MEVYTPSVQHAASPVLSRPSSAQPTLPHVSDDRESETSVLDLSIFAAVAASAPLIPLAPKPSTNNHINNNRQVSQFIGNSATNTTATTTTLAEDSLLASPLLKGADLDQISKMIKQRLAQYQRQGVIQGPYVSPQKRSVHNFCERRRRENIRQGFAMLQRKLLELEGKPRTDHMSKMDTLRKSVETVSRIREDTMALEDEVNLLKQIKSQLILKRKDSSTTAKDVKE